MNRRILQSIWLTFLTGACAAACGGATIESTELPKILSFEEYEAQAAFDPETGMYRVEGDIKIPDRAMLVRAYEDYVAGMKKVLASMENEGELGENREPLSVMRLGGNMDDIWSEGERKSLTYCVTAPDFDASGPGRYAAVLSAMEYATSQWEGAANVRFQHIADQDWNCSSANSLVNFYVRRATGGTFYAAAFYPHYPRTSRSIDVDDIAFTAIPQDPLNETMLHEVGHVLGYVHEHSRTTLGNCPNRETSFRTLTAYDSASIMHYQPTLCSSGTASPIQTLTTLDRQGARRSYGLPNAYFADVNNDGRADGVVVHSFGTWVALSNGSSFDGAVQWASDISYGLLGTHLRDVTNDGRADLILVNPMGISVRINTAPNSFAAAVDWSDGPFYGAMGTYFADLTNDRRAEAIVVNDFGPVAVRKSNGSLFNPVESWTTAPEIGTIGTYFADVTADGRADLIVVNNTQVLVRRANTSGTVFRDAQSWMTMPTTTGKRGFYFADVTGDNRADFIEVSDTGISVARSTGSAFTSQTTWSKAPFFGDRGTKFADVTGDGRADAIAVNDSGIVVRRAQTDSKFGPEESWAAPFYGSE